MRNLLIVAALVAAPAFGQNVATSTQSGSSHSVAIDQTGSNTAEIDQQGTNQMFDATQDGSGNLITNFRQAGDANSATIVQIGTDNQVQVAEQVGNGNVLEIDQDGERNFAGVDNGSDPRPDAIDQERDNNFGDIDQMGNDNQAFLEQRGVNSGNGNRGVIYQDGNNNVAVVDQVKDDHVAEVRQTGGNFNEFTANQGGGTGNQIVDFRQTGSNNTAMINQIGNNNQINSADQEGSNHTLDAFQKGDDNMIGDLSTPPGDPLGAADQRDSDNEAYLSQNGNMNTLFLEQEGVSGIITSTQLGDNNYSELRQESNGTGENVMTITQDGADNARLSQFGGLNTISLMQGGGAAVQNATITQNGSGNSAVVTQN